MFVSRNPLKLVISRFPRYEVLYSNPEQEKLTGWLDTLECGHQVELPNFGLSEPSFGPESGPRRRRRCGECAVEAHAKKPAQSVRFREAGPGKRVKAI
jgi:hypothetical protein